MAVCGWDGDGYSVLEAQEGGDDRQTCLVGTGIGEDKNVIVLAFGNGKGHVVTQLLGEDNSLFHNSLKVFFNHVWRGAELKGLLHASLEQK